MDNDCDVHSYADWVVDFLGPSKGEGVHPPVLSHAGSYHGQQPKRNAGRQKNVFVEGRIAVIQVSQGWRMVVDVDVDGDGRWSLEVPELELGATWGAAAPLSIFGYLLPYLSFNNHSQGDRMTISEISTSFISFIYGRSLGGRSNFRYLS